MKNKSKILIVSLALAAALSVSLTGCGDKLNKTPETESETVKVTEAPTEKVTEAPTEKVTEAPTEPPTETETETEEPKELTPEEEKAAETELKGNKTLYAADDINIRTEPNKEDDTNIIGSYDQGEEVTVSAETKNWYKVEKDGYSGYVYKEGLSETAVEPKSAEERAQIMEQQGNSGSSSTDLEYDVRSYAESFPLILASDANMRSVPDSEGQILTTISSGTHVTALGETERWYKVEYDGTTGYVNKNLFK